MALLFIDGFEGNDFSQGKWNNSTSPATVTSPARFAFPGSRALAMATPSARADKNIAETAQVTCGFGFYSSGGITASGIASLWNTSGTILQLTLAMSPSGVLQVWRGATLLATGTTYLAGNTWYHIAFQATISPTSGTAVVRINGSASNEISFTGNTQNSGSSTTVDRVSIGDDQNGRSTGGTICFDDFYIADGATTHNNSFLGDVRVYPLSPAGAGAFTQLTSSGANPDWQNAGTLPVQSVAFNSSATSGNKDTYTLGSLPADAVTVLGVQSNVYAAKSDAGAAGAYGIIYTAATTYLGAVRALSTSFVTYSDMFDLDPNTSAAWTVAQVNSLQAGMQVQ